MSVNSDRGPVEPSESHLRGGRLAVTRAGSALVVAFALAVFVAGLPVAFDKLRIVCAGACPDWRLNAARAHALAGLGVSPDAFAVLEVVGTVLTSLIWFGIAAVVFRRRSDRLIPLLVAVQLVTQGASNGANALIGTHSAWDTAASLLEALNSILFFAFLALFPSGRFAPRWVGWLLIPAGAATAAQLVPGAPAALQLAFPVTAVLLLAAQVYRYLAVSTSVRRQQTKWVLLGVSASLAMHFGLLLPPALVPTLSAPASLYTLSAAIVTNLTLTLGPIGFMFGVLRYRLYDIDLIINRALVYGSLTAILASVYFGAVVGSQQVVRAFAGAEAAKQPIIIVLSTLLIAALFSPLRHGLQRGIDRRFYREKYDASRTLERFAASLRSDLDLAELRAHLLGVVEETLQPTHVSLWLRPPTRREP